MRRGFTLLEVVIALAVLGGALAAIFQMNAGALKQHTYAKRLTTACFLAKSKMTDIEQKLLDKGFPGDREEESGDFSDAGESAIRWKSEILAPDLKATSLQKIMDQLLPLSADATKASGSGPSVPSSPLQGLLQAQLGTLTHNLGQWVREVRLTVSFPDGESSEEVQLVTHVVSLGPGTYRQAPPSLPVPGIITQ